MRVDSSMPPLNLAYILSIHLVDRGGEELSHRDASYCKTFAAKFLIEKHLIDAASGSRAKRSRTHKHGLYHSKASPVR